MADEPTNELMLTILRELQSGQAELRKDVQAIRDEIAATRSVLVDVIVQLTTRVTRLEKV